LVEQITDCCSRLLGESVGAKDNFFLAGLDSLGAVKLAALVAEMSEVDVSHEVVLQTLFTSPDPTALAGSLSANLTRVKRESWRDSSQHLGRGQES
jgi:hypothetical protein